MNLSEESIKKFQKLYKEQYGEDISYEDAYDLGPRLINLMKVIARPIPKEWAQRYEELRKETEEYQAKLKQKEENS